MRFFIADTFMKSLERLSPEEQGLTKQAAFALRSNPIDPGYGLHELDHACDPRFSSLRVDPDICMIVHRVGAESVMLCYAAHHDDAHRWAERRQLQVHPTTLAAQFVEVKERVEEVVREVVRVEEPPLFQKYDQEYLLGLGVPPEWVEALLILGETAFMEIASELPEEAAERLLELAAGQAVPLPTPAPATDPLQHPDAQRRFRQLETENELQAALDAPWERWMFFLHPTQRSLVEGQFTGPVRVTGGAGTGKSVVALHRAAYLARRFPETRVLLTTFSKALAVRLEHHLRRLLGQDPARARITVQHLLAVAGDLVLGEGERFSPVSRQELDELIVQALHGRKNQWLTEAFIRSEWDSVVDAHGISSFSAYKAVSRKGRGVALSAKKRKLVWAVMEALLAELERRGQGVFGLFTAAATRNVASKPLYGHVVVDECQDFGAAELGLLRALCPAGPNDLFFCGDEGQRIYRYRVSWRSLGIDVRGRSTRLKFNYRTTEPIRRRADLLLPAEVTDGDGSREHHDTVSMLPGPAPELLGFDSPEAERDTLTRWLVARRDEGLALHEIAVLARTTKLLEDRVAAAVVAADLPSQALTDDALPSADKIALGTLHGAKGLEFRAVAIVGCDQDQLPLSSVACQMKDPVDREEFMEHERHLLYVACTRARARLLVTWIGEGCGWLGW